MEQENMRNDMAAADEGVQGGSPQFSGRSEYSPSDQDGYSYAAVQQHAGYGNSAAAAATGALPPPPSLHVQYENQGAYNPYQQEQQQQQQYQQQYQQQQHSQQQGGGGRYGNYSQSGYAPRSQDFYQQQQHGAHGRGGKPQYQQQQEPMSNRDAHEAAVQRKASNDTRYFWELVAAHQDPTRGGGGYKKQQQRSNSSNSGGQKSQNEERILFGKKQQVLDEESTGGDAAVIQDDSIPVERSGPRCNEVGTLDSFLQLQEYRVPEYVLRNIELMRYEQPTPIQKHAVPLGLAGIDLMCCAQTGSGKTFSFLLPVVAALAQVTAGANADLTDAALIDAAAAGAVPPRVSVDASKGCMPLAVVLAPTRELALQIHMDARRLMYCSGLKPVCVYGGSDMRSQLQELSTGCDLIVATPGRLNDLLERGVVSLSQVAFLVLDEADRMLDMGFEPQIRGIVQGSDMPQHSEGRTTFMFSATFPAEIQTLAKEFLKDYVWVAVGRVGSTVENITQQILPVTSDPQQKLQLLGEVIAQTDGRTLIFVQKRRTASWLCSHLRNALNLRAEEIHGDRSQAQREHALRQFRDGSIRVLVATDVAARGLDVPAVTHVVQFDMPLSSDDFDVYVHRIGRTGRAGRTGLATSFFVPGRELGEGNGKIAQPLLQLLQENNQSVPEWFLSLDDLRGGGGGGGASRNSRQQMNNRRYQQQYGAGSNRYGNSASSSRYGNMGVNNESNYGGGGGYQQQQQQGRHQYNFGGRDVRGYAQQGQQYTPYYQQQHPQGRDPRSSGNPYVSNNGYSTNIGGGGGYVPPGSQGAYMGVAAAAAPVSSPVAVSAAAFVPAAAAAPYAAKPGYNTYNAPAAYQQQQQHYQGGGRQYRNPAAAGGMGYVMNQPPAAAYGQAAGYGHHPRYQQQMSQYAAAPVSGGGGYMNSAVLDGPAAAQMYAPQQQQQVYAASAGYGGQYGPGAGYAAAPAMQQQPNQGSNMQDVAMQFAAMQMAAPYATDGSSGSNDGGAAPHDSNA